MKRCAEDDEPGNLDRATAPCSAARGTGKELKEVLRARRPDHDFADEVLRLREFIGQAQDVRPTHFAPRP